MERRRHRMMVLLVVVALHVPFWFVLRALTSPVVRPAAPTEDLRVEFVLNDARPAPPPIRRSRAGGSPGARPVIAARKSEEPSHLDSRLRGNDERVRLFAADGSLRISSTLADDIAAKDVEGPNTFHIPAGDTWVLREPKAPIEFTASIFAQGYLPEDMNPVEEACWRNKALAFVLAMVGSQDCADPGGKTRRPPPAMIVYGVDDGETILQKTEDWGRYNE